ncbi:hypothetical protein LTR62_003448 [Meristemomyces frigidus]|uniref:Tr-type G domain-containing protein n=1 Tax=Meristemomyces frigidus TaxID=1508187 RepID=A0AAN7YRR6_9PEZI|nr:hypothetical protein LTR62_003448 [Meristemomyces frigidus]
MGVASMQRVKNVDYDENDLYDEPDYDEPEETYTDEDRNNFATLTPVVRAELEEASLQASDREIEDALWNYYWDVAKSVTYLKNSKKPKTQEQLVKKEKVKSKFDQAAEKSAQESDSRNMIPYASWFRDVPWILPEDKLHSLVPAMPFQRPVLLGGSSKLAKLAEERRKKATATSIRANGNTSLSALDRLTKTKAFTENEKPVVEDTPERRKYPIRSKREPTPPPREPTPPSVEREGEKPDLRALPTEFGYTLSTSLLDRDRPTLSTSDVLAAAKAPAKQTGNGLIKRTESLSLDTPSLDRVQQAKVKSKGLDVPRLWEEEKAKRKASAAFVVIGHVDHGKSTLMGRLLLDTGAVAQRDIDKYQKQASELGKTSFALAWVMDTGTEERERGVTFDFAQHHFSTTSSDFTILDAPGHRDFVPNMIGGASMADMALLVVDANQLDSGMKGQTKEHIMLAKAVGLKRIIVAVNKLDSTSQAWDQKEFTRVQAAVTKLLRESGFAEDDIAFVPCSGLSGQNVAKKPSGEDTTWIGKAHLPPLLQALEAFSTESAQNVDLLRPLRMQVVDLFRGSITNPLSVSGRISSGHLQVGDVVYLQPAGETATVKAIEVSEEPKDFAVAGQICTLHLQEISSQHIKSGDMLCSQADPVTVTKDLSLLISVVDPLLPQPVDVHMGRLHLPGTIKQLVETVDSNGEQLKRKPRVLKGGQRARVKVSLDEGAAIEAGERIVLRSGGATAAYGTVE